MNSKEKELIKKYESLEGAYEEAKKTWLKEKRDLTDKIEDSAYIYEKRIKELKQEIEKLNKLLEEAEPKNLKNLKEENQKLSNLLKEVNLDEKTFKVKELEAVINVLNKEIAYKNTLIDRYQELPDIKKMLENLSSLKVPALDELKSFFEVFKSDETSKKIDRLTKLIEEELRFRRY